MNNAPKKLLELLQKPDKNAMSSAMENKGERGLDGAASRNLNNRGLSLCDTGEFVLADGI